MEREFLLICIDRNLSIRDIADEANISYTTVRYWLKKYDLKTLPTSKKTWSDENLKSAVAGSKTLAEVIRSLGLAVAAGNYVNIKRRVEELDLNTEHWLGQRWVSDPSRRRILNIPIEKILVEGSSFSTSNLRKRLIAEGLKEEKCERCGLFEWLGEKLPLELDHINGVSNDHRLHNLKILCPNCHALTPTWRGRKNRKIKAS